jgi:hypothetical protein
LVFGSWYLTSGFWPFLAAGWFVFLISFAPIAASFFKIVHGQPAPASQPKFLPFLC